MLTLLGMPLLQQVPYCAGAGLAGLGQVLGQAKRAPQIGPGSCSSCSCHWLRMRTAR